MNDGTNKVPVSHKLPFKDYTCKRWESSCLQFVAYQDNLHKSTVTLQGTELQCTKISAFLELTTERKIKEESYLL